MSCPDVTIVGEAESVHTGLELLNTVNPDCVFLDVQMGDGTGFDLLEKLAEDVVVVFVTAFEDYAIRAFEYNTIDYLLKPISIERLVKAVEKVQSRRSNDEYFKQLANLLHSVKSRDYTRLTLQTQKAT